MLPMKQVLLISANGPAAGTPIATWLLAETMPMPALLPMHTLLLPSRILFPASLPTPVLLSPLVTLMSASSPKAEFPKLSLFSKARSPNALFSLPLTLLKSASRPWALLKVPVSLSRSALTPNALSAPPVVLKKSAAAPTAVLGLPLLKNSVPAPTPVLKKASVLLNSENHPKAELKALPEFSRALYPSAVLLLTGKGDGSGLSGPAAPNASPKQASTDRIVANIVMLLRFFIILIFLSLFWPSLIFPRRALARHPSGESVTMPFPVQPLILISVAKRFAKNAEGCQERKIKFFGAEGMPARCVHEPSVSKALPHSRSFSSLPYRT